MKSKDRKILFLWAIWMGDRIASIPYFIEKKKEWKKIVLLEYEDKYFHRFYQTNDTLNFLKQNNLYDELLVIPYNKLKLVLFIFKNLFKYKESFAPTKTFVISIRWKLFSRNFKYAFKNLNDNSKYDNFISGMLDENYVDYYSYSNRLKVLPYNSEFHKKFGITNNFVTVYVWPYWWSIEYEEWLKLVNYLRNLWLQIVLLWWDWEDREWWIIKYIKDKSNIINLLWKTSFEDIFSILKNAKFTISANWWIMWLSHFLNERNISFSISSWFIIHPPVNNKTSFHIHANACPFPCEIRKSENYYKKNWFNHCIYSNTEKKWCCKKVVDFDVIKKYIDKLLA